MDSQPLPKRARFAPKHQASTGQHYPSHQFQPRYNNQKQQRQVGPIVPRGPVYSFPPPNHHILPFAPPTHTLGPMFSSFSQIPSLPIGSRRSPPHMALPILTPPISPPQSMQLKEEKGEDIKADFSLTGGNNEGMNNYLDVDAILRKLKKASEHRVKTGDSLDFPPVHLVSKRGSTAPPLPTREERRLLSIRYSSVVKYLLSKRVCNECGIPMEKISGDRFNAHMDNHMKEKLSKRKEAKSRAFYCSAEDWVNTKEDEEEKIEQRISPWAKIKAVASTNDRKKEKKEKPSVNCEETNTIMCSVCGEEFTSYYDDDSDMWKWRDCVKMGDEICHENCAPDLPLMDDVKIETIDLE